jgi:squalene-hopene/tetraprenyl-beta-curcumene cyclase
VTPVALAFVLGLGAAEPTGARLAFAAPGNVSLRHEVQHAIDQGLGWLAKNQATNGAWSTPDHPAITALALTAFRLKPGSGERANEPATETRGYAYLLDCRQPDGGIYRRDLPSYNTAVSLVALVFASRPEYEPVIVKARQFIVGLQTGPREPGQTNDPFAGGIGYGKTDKRPDLSNTSLALEALALSRRYVADKNLAGTNDLDWAAAIRFIQSCQNLPAYNPASWASDDAVNKGGFVYAPGHSMAGETNLPSGRVALRSYGSMSYAGLLSYIYANLRRDDPRVRAVVDWLRNNYTLEENPALGAQGLFYYYHTLAKALTVYGTDTLETRDHREVDWREQLALKLINLQRADGSWANENNRWWEKDPALVTAYALIALELVHGRL